MELTSLEASAGVPIRMYNMMSVILNLQQLTRVEMWLFDCGGGTQHQFLHTPYHPGKPNKIFIIHLHGDHLPGLPGLLYSCSMQGNSLPLTPYGPKGLKKFVEAVLYLSGSWTDYPFIIIEVGPGLVLDEEGYRVIAHPLGHPMERYGYHTEQHDKPSTPDAVQLIAGGMPPGPLFHQPKRGQYVTLEDGRVVDGSCYLEPATPGKMLTTFGDIAPYLQALEMARGADVMIHETTPRQAMAEKANGCGHSSSQWTAALTRETGAGTLIAIHFNSRYDVEGRLKMLAKYRETFTNTLSAGDFMVYKIA